MQGQKYEQLLSGKERKIAYVILKALDGLELQQAKNILDFCKATATDIAEVNTLQYFCDGS